MLKQAIDELYHEFPYSYSLGYSAKFRPYRANVRLSSDNVHFSLSKKWKTVSREIQIGLIQELLLKIMKKRLNPITKNTQNMDLYNIFMRKVHIAAPKTDVDPILEQSFDRVNKAYFHGLLDKTNLKWANTSLSRLGSYEYGTDTICISRILEDADDAILDYIMYHEMLHKKYKFIKRGSRSYHHTSEFKRKEKEFENSKVIEKRLRNLLIKKRFSLRNMLSRSGFL
ncbi:SprT-like domain-containing protein [Candidatus Woesearchaeota archaeon]|nr:SprT-like domain-containing protein [Candidatus Woesearchaeota archaeon]